MEPVLIDYDRVLRAALTGFYPSPELRARAEEVLSRYGEKDFHREVPRVRVAILKLAGAELDRLERETEAACCDYRDVLSYAEYPRQIGRWGRKAIEPEKYAAWVAKDLQEYRDWIAAIMEA